MKTTTFILIALATTLAFSCSKKADTVSPSLQGVAEQKSIVASTTWRIDYFVERGVNNTSNLSGYQFEFNSSGSMAVTGSETTFTGTWNVTQKDSKPDDSGHTSLENKFNILVTGNKQMDEISEDWTVTKITTNAIWLADDNPASPKEIHFVK